MTAQQQLVAARPPARATGGRRRAAVDTRIRKVMRSRVFRVIAAVLLVLLIWTSWSIGRPSRRREPTARPPGWPSGPATIAWGGSSRIWRGSSTGSTRP